ncbi:MAG: autotransporter domain-containing protein [Burkholderiaceae bacterium]|nr:autotransporter domain-containing protein [Burkholderiaceae bacterium]
MNSLRMRFYFSYSINSAVEIFRQFNRLCKIFITKILRFISCLLLLGFSFGVHAQTTISNGQVINLSMTSGQAFSQVFIGTGTLNNAYSVQGNLPPGISTSTGLPPAPATFNTALTLSGAPSVAGNYTFDVTVVATSTVAVVNYSVRFNVSVASNLPPAPSAGAGNFSVQANTLTNSLALNIGGAATSLVISTAPQFGSAAINGLAITYSPAANFVGRDSFIYAAIGPGGQSAPALVTIDVVAANSSTSVNIQANSSNNSLPVNPANGVGLVAISVAPSHGTATVNGGSIVYTPTLNFIGSDSLSYTLSGANGVFASNTISINVTGQAPTVKATALTVTSGASVSIDLATLVSGPTFLGVSFAVVGTPTNGNASLVGSILTYRPNAKFVGVDNVGFTARTIAGVSSNAQIQITVTARPDPSSNRTVRVIQAASETAVRRFEQTQLDNFNARLTELAVQSKKLPGAQNDESQQACGKVSPWIGGLNGSGSYRGSNGFKFDTNSASLGADRCFNSGTTVVGLGLAYAKEKSDFGFDGSKLRATAATGTTYGKTSLLPNFQIGWVAGFNQIDNDYDRFIEVANDFAHGKWSGKQWITSINGSGDFMIGAINVIPFGRLDLSRLRLNPYSETGNNAFLLKYQTQNIRGSRTTVGFNADYPIEVSFGKIIPRAYFAVQHDFAGRSPVAVSYIDDTNGAVYLIPSNDLDRNVVFATCGADFIWSEGLQIVAKYAYSSASQGARARSFQLRASLKF